MGKNFRKRAGGEYDQLQQLKHENQSLKRELSRLKKQLDRIDLNKFSNIKELIEPKRTKLEEKELYNELWKCFECGKGTLLLHLIERLDGAYYYRACELCSHRTRLKKYTAEVKPGPKKER